MSIADTAAAVQYCNANKKLGILSNKVNAFVLLTV